MKVFRLPLWVSLCGFLSSGVWCCILCGCMWPFYLGEPRAFVWRNMCLLPWYIWFIGICILSHLPLPLPILVFRAPSLGDCTLGVFQSLGTWPRLFDPDGLSCLLLSCWFFPVLSCFVYCVCGYCYVGWYLRLNCYHIVGHYIVAFHTSCSGIIYVYQRDVAHAFIVWVRNWLLCLCVIWDEGGIVWDGCQFPRPGVMVTFSFPLTLWCGAGSGGTVVAGCCVLPLRCCCSGVSTLGSCALGADGACGTVTLKMATSFLNTAVCFYLSWGMGMDGVGFWRTSIRSAAALVTESAGERLGNFFWTGKSSVVLDTCSNAVLGM